MAERSFAREVQDLKLGEGDEFRGEGILAITKALLQSGVSYVGGYQGAPISHLMDVLADAKDVLDDLGVHFENSASEAAAAATLAASVMYPIRGAVTFKAPVGISPKVTRQPAGHRTSAGSAAGEAVARQSGRVNKYASGRRALNDTAQLRPGGFHGRTLVCTRSAGS